MKKIEKADPLLLGTKTAKAALGTYSPKKEKKAKTRQTMHSSASPAASDTHTHCSGGIGKE